MCPKKLDSMFEISHADLSFRRKRFPRFAGLSTGLQPVCPLLGFAGHFAVKIDVFGNQNIFKDHVRTARGITPVFSLFAVNQIIFLSIWMSKSELFFYVWNLPCLVENGGPDRTRTYDPRLIKAVL